MDQEVDVQGAMLVSGEFSGALVAKVYLGGVEQSGVIAADPDKGFVIRGVRGETGRYLFDQKKGEFVTERADGKVSVRWRNPNIAERWLRRQGLDPAIYMEPR